MIGRILGNRLYLSLVGVIAVLIVTVLYMLSAVLDVPLTGATTVNVQMKATGGLFEGSAVTYRGVKVGKVKTIRLNDSGVLATISLTGSEQIPKDSLAKVRSLSPVGEQYLDFQPRSKGGPYLTQGSTIPAESTDLPKSLSSTVISINRLLEQIDDEKLHTLLTELSTGLAGTGQELGRMVDQGELLVADLQRMWPQTESLLTNADTALDIVPDTQDQLHDLAIYSRQFARFLRNYDPELRRMLHVLPGQIKSLHAMFVDASAVLPGFLGEAVRFSDFFMSYEPHFRALMAAYAPGLGTLADAVKDGVLQITAYPLAHDRCDYGVPRRSPKNTVRRPMIDTGNCPQGRRDYQRGAQYSPGAVR